MTATVSGTWWNSAVHTFEADPQHGVLPVPDPEHRKRDSAVQNPAWQAPQYQGAISADPLAPTVVGLEVFDVPPVVPIIDRTLEGHNVEESHSADHGASEKNLYSPSAYEFSNERYYGFYLEGNPRPAITEKAQGPYGRGLNAADMNNPPIRSYGGRRFRPGLYFGSNVNRRFAPPRRQHDHRFVRPDVVTIIGDAPPPRLPDKYSSPFSSLQRFRKDIKAKPMLRRIPAPFDEDLLYDGANAPLQQSVGMHGW